MRCSRSFQIYSRRAPRIKSKLVMFTKISEEHRKTLKTHTKASKNHELLGEAPEQKLTPTHDQCRIKITYGARGSLARKRHFVQDWRMSPLFSPFLIFSFSVDVLLFFFTPMFYFLLFIFFFVFSFSFFVRSFNETFFLFFTNDRPCINKSENWYKMLFTKAN